MVYYACQQTFFQIEFSVDCSKKDLFWWAHTFPPCCCKKSFPHGPLTCSQSHHHKWSSGTPKKCKTRKLPIFYWVNSLVFLIAGAGNSIQFLGCSLVRLLTTMSKVAPTKAVSLFFPEIYGLAARLYIVSCELHIEPFLWEEWTSEVVL